MSTLTKTRAAGDTTSSDIASWLPGVDSPRRPATMPLIAALSRQGVLVLSTDTTAKISFALPTPTLPVLAAEQLLEKSSVLFKTLSAPLSDVELHTIAVGTDLSLQAEVLGVDTQARVEAILTSAVSAAADRFVADALAAAAVQVADVDEALSAVAAWPGPRLIVTNSISGTADRLAAADSSEGGLIVVVDPLISHSLVIAVDAVSMWVHGPDTLSAIRPARVGRDITSACFIAGPVIGAAAVAEWGATP